MLVTLQTLHGHFRWLVLLAAAVHLITLVYTIASGSAPAKLQRIAGSIFTGFLDIQLLLGIVLLAGKWMTFGFPGRVAMEHVSVMIVAVGLMHATRMWRKAEPRVQARNTLIVLLAVVLLILVGIARVTAVPA